ncbi:MAG: hypothetical protein HY423_03170 [Candidatus Lambdaproteobacteria bacterium]|nr:hypothetical protein [Candidatus Lambdaproteobacteria bacterium]
MKQHELQIACWATYRICNLKNWNPGKATEDRLEDDRSGRGTRHLEIGAIGKIQASSRAQGVAEEFGVRVDRQNPCKLGMLREHFRQEGRAGLLVIGIEFGGAGQPVGQLHRGPDFVFKVAGDEAGQRAKPLTCLGKIGPAMLQEIDARHDRGHKRRQQHQHKEAAANAHTSPLR